MQRNLVIILNYLRLPKLYLLFVYLIFNITFTLLCNLNILVYPLSILNLLKFYYKSHYL